MGQGRRNRQIPRVASSLLDLMWRQVRGERGRERGREAFNDEMLSNQSFVDFVVEWWPPLDAPTVLGWLREPDFLARVAEGVLTEEQQRLLSKSWSSSETTPSVEDVPLLDELRYALGDVPTRAEEDHELDDFLGGDVQELTSAVEREYGSGGRRWTPPTNSIEDDPFAHVLIDEAQDLTPMQWRMVGRRGRVASWTIVGDPAQSSWPVPAEAAEARAAALEGKELHEFHLSTNYRNSSEIYAYAAAYAQRVGLDADLPTAVRSTGVEPREVVGSPDLEAATAIGGGGGRRPGRRHRRRRRPRRPPLRRQRLAGLLARARRRRPQRPRRHRLLGHALGRRPDRRPHRPRHQGPGVRRHRRRPAGRRSRPSPPPAPPPSTSSSPAPPSSSPSSPSARSRR